MADEQHAPVPELDAFSSEMAMLGGAVLGGGGGGKLETGLHLSQAIQDMGAVELLALDSISPQGSLAILAVFRATGMEGTSRCSPPHERAIELLQGNTGIEVAGLVNCGSGAVDSLVGWVQSNRSGVPLLDVIFDPTIHPSPVIGLIMKNTALSFAMVGSNPHGQEIELFSPHASPLLLDILRQNAFVEKTNTALAIGPISPARMKQWGATGRISKSLRLGQAMIEKAEDDGELTAKIILQELKGELLLFCVVTDQVWEGEQDHEHGIIHLQDEQNRSLEILFWHRYIALYLDGERLAIFPDLITILGSKGTPLEGNELATGQEVYVVVAPASQAAPGSIYQEMEHITGKSLVPSVDPTFLP